MNQAMAAANTVRTNMLQQTKELLMTCSKLLRNELRTNLQTLSV
jgi:hypothetical protein